MEIFVIAAVMALGVLIWIRFENVQSERVDADGGKTEATVAEWAHGFQTDRVVATRYTNPSFGFHVGFRFPKDPYDCDGAGLIGFITSLGFGVYQCGGYPGAEIRAVHSDIASVDDANRQLPDIVAKLDAYMRGRATLK